MSDAVRLWRTCAALLRAQVSDPVWHTAFEGIRAVDYDGRTLTLGVPSPLAKERIEGRYLGLVRDALVEANAGHAELRLQIDPPEPQDISPLELLAQNPPTAFVRNLRSIAGIARAAEADTLFSTFAWDVPVAEHALSQHPDYYQLEAQLNAIAEQNALILQLAADLDVHVVDLAAEMGAGAYFQADMVHQTVEGARRQAEIYAAFLDEQGLIRR